MLKGIKNYFKKSIKKMVEENEKSFGNGKLDCCDLNRANNTIRKDNTKRK